LPRGTYTIAVTNAIADIDETALSEALVLTAGGVAVAGSQLTGISNYFGGVASLVDTDVIQFSGFVADGTAFSGSLAVGAANTVTALMTAIQTAINGAVAGTTDDVAVSLTAGGEIQIKENLLNVGSLLSVNLNVDSLGGGGAFEGSITTASSATATAGSAVVTVGGGPAQTVAHNSTVTFYGPAPASDLDPTPQIDITFTDLTEGNDTLTIVQQEWQGVLDGGSTVTFQNGDQEVQLKNGTSAGFESGEYALMNFGATVTAGTVQIAVVNNGLNFHIGANENQDITVGIGDLRSSNLGNLGVTGQTVADIDVRTNSGANRAITIIDAAIEQVSRQRSYLGSITNRLEKTINNLGVSSENLTASESRIRDADIAFETTRFTRNQILLQAGTAILAQANIAPQSVLQLLG